MKGDELMAPKIIARISFRLCSPQAVGLLTQISPLGHYDTTKAYELIEGEEERSQW